MKGPAAAGNEQRWWVRLSAQQNRSRNDAALFGNVIKTIREEA
jgi:hypothetical protein